MCNVPATGKDPRPVPRPCACRPRPRPSRRSWTRHGCLGRGRPARSRRVRSSASWRSSRQIRVSPVPTPVFRDRDIDALAVVARLQHLGRADLRHADVVGHLYLAVEPYLVDALAELLCGLGGRFVPSAGATSLLKPVDFFALSATPSGASWSPRARLVERGRGPTVAGVTAPASSPAASCDGPKGVESSPVWTSSTER
jgi:hypothetical protein